MTAAFEPNEPYVTVHVVEVENGHLNSMDCWCEPAAHIFQRNAKGTLMRLVAHEDLTLEHHNTVLAIRNQRQGWITSFLSRVGVKKGNHESDDR